MARYLIVLAAIIGCAIADGTGHHAHDHGHSAYAAPAAAQEAYGAPSAPADAYGAPAAQPEAYGAPAAPVEQYGAPAAAPVSYEAPTSAYGAPAAEYGAPSAPADAYGAPASAYGAPADAYGAPADTYGAPQQYAETTGYSDQYDTAEAKPAFDLSAIMGYMPFLLSVFAAIIVAQLFSPLLGLLFGAKLDLAQGLLAPLSSAKIDVVNAVLSPFNLVLGNVGTCTPATGRALGGNWNMSPDNVLSMIYKANEIYSEFA